VIPLWLRALAGLVAAAAVLAILLLIRNGPPGAGEEAGVLGMAGRALLFLGMAALFGYAAVTGLPPAHWWRGAAEPLLPARAPPALTPDLHRFLTQLRERHPGLRECWLLDPVEAGEWRLLAMAPPAVVEAVRGDWDIRRPDIRLFLADDASGAVGLAWGRVRPEPFASWDWEPQRDPVAEFRCPASGDIRQARRLWRS
jgi:hypothetical protein